MVSNKKNVLFLIALIFLFPSCINLKQPAIKISYYMLEYDPPRIEGLDPLANVIRLERFSVSPGYDSNRIVYRDRSFARDAYAYHKWHANPGDMVSFFLKRDIKASGLFKAVLPPGSSLSSTHKLEGSVDEFYEVDNEALWEAVLSVSITLMSENEPDVSKRVLFQKTYSAREA